LIFNFNIPFLILSPINSHAPLHFTPASPGYAGPFTCPG
jgi:hypothetical protein